MGRPTYAAVRVLVLGLSLPASGRATRQRPTERDLTPRVSNLSGDMPSGGRVEAPGPLVVGERPQNALAVARVEQVIEGGAHQPTAYATAPDGRRYRDCVQFSEVKVDRIATWSGSRKTDDRLANCANHHRTGPPPKSSSQRATCSWSSTRGGIRSAKPSFQDLR